ncbi:glutamate 5-kinase [Nesterenkonia aerolata]|uniref:Glutamate 5-kinase n=1 Tax=Nesterenkonia aerolata TaxID=3074079 RepID=A0ABU2DVD1_9MICC|nr:glutamate 5-kinase [Nesterenkonia sp. LY-0111]MDR8020465.1 glutamate 5-kinase [Nesterenkonia sp. LY-0111]
MSTPRLRDSFITSQADLVKARRLVVKIGSSSLTTLDGGISVAALERLVDALQTLRTRGTQVVLVSSGAIAAGLAPLTMGVRPQDLAGKQAAAAVGQGLLMAHYSRTFGQYGAVAAQLLLTVEDLIRRSQYTNALRSIERLLSMGAVPIINENDAVATHEIRFGDNDRLAALTANLIHADALILLSDVDALYDGPPAEGGTALPVIDGPEALAAVRLGGSGKAGLGTGGMVTKVGAAEICTNNGIPAMLTSADRAPELFAGEAVGTFFTARGRRRGARSAWLTHLAHTEGRVVVDAGAVSAVVGRRRSLLPAGITACEGVFEASDPVDVVGPDGVVVARGIASYSSQELPRMMGRTTAALAEEMGPDYDRPVIHTDDMVRLG